MTRDQLMKDFEQTFSIQFDCGNFLANKDNVVHSSYTDNLTYWCWLSWVSAFENYSPDRITG